MPLKEKTMDFDLGNILYIVITLIAVIAGLAGRKKKPAPGSEGGTGDAKPGFMENLENILKMDQEDPVVTNLREDEEDLPHEGETEPELVGRGPVMEETPEKSAYMEEYERILHRMESGETLDAEREGRESSDEPLEVIDLDQDEGTDYFNIVRDFDAETAVIYAAIINRVDYS